jgi:hypothetical protein
MICAEKLLSGVLYPRREDVNIQSDGQNHSDDQGRSVVGPETVLQDRKQKKGQQYGDGTIYLPAF